MNKPPIITIDGPSGAGKGTVAYRLAEHFGINLLDSGALYRIVGLMAHRAGLIDGTLDETAIANLSIRLELSFRTNSATRAVDVYVNGESLAEDIRNETVGAYASKVASLPKVRAALLDLQKNMGAKGVVADGRDMGTVIFPNADAKVFLTASPEARADRRVKQLLAAGKTADYDVILADIKARDERDENRSIAPSRPADDALILDSSQMDAETVFAEVLAFVEAKLNKNCAEQNEF